MAIRQTYNHWVIITTLSKISFYILEINECATGPCENGATCHDKVNGYFCECAEGYDDTLCDNNINDCSPNPCLNGGQCSDGVASYTCSNCNEGFNGPKCENGMSLKKIGGAIDGKRSLAIALCKICYAFGCMNSQLWYVLFCFVEIQYIPSHSLHRNRWMPIWSVW